jgi:glycosyltransferase involved in cell wall biosynthesis
MLSSGSPIAVYVPHYLHISMPFVYRQIIGMDEWFPTIVLTSWLSNIHLFPFEPIHHYPKTLIDKISHRLYKWRTGLYCGAGIRQQRHWSQALKKHKAKLIHAHFGPGGLDMLSLSQHLSIPLLVSFRGYDASRLLSNQRYVDSLPILLQTAQALTVSEDIRQRLIALGLPATRIHTHYTGIPLEKFPFIQRKPIRDKVAANEPLTFLQVSSLNEKKGHQYTLQAFKDFLPFYPNSRLVLAGDGILRNELEGQTRLLGISEKVDFLGSVSQDIVQSLMPIADAFFHHSVTAYDGDQEGIPTALQEAMATGLPVISTYHAGIPEVVSNDENGYLVSERDTNGMTQKMILLLSCDTQIGLRAFETIKDRFDLSKQNQKLRSRYLNLIEGCA